MFKFIVLAICSVSSLWAVPAHVNEKENGLRIIGGTTARAGQFSFAAAITITTSTGTYFCTGTLISDQWIVTAGQCVTGATQFNIILGSNVRTGKNDPNAKKFATDYYEIHPKFNASTLENDVGLIKLRLPITFTDYIRPIDTIPSTTLPAYSKVITLGWGQTSDEDAGLVNELNYVFLTSLSNQECRQAYGYQVNDNQVCVDGNYNEGTCKGDSGSPLIQNGATGKVYLVGISSFLSGNGCESTDPSGFTRTSPYREWIGNVTGI